ncbi:MAG TPA: flagellar biosynthesis anti-sigma factor FlgM [Limnochordales bacterium]
MMVSDKQVHQVAKLFAAQLQVRPAGKVTGPEVPLRPDSVELSRESREVQAAWQAIQAAPEVRTEKVEQIRAALEAGTYRVSGREVAKKMIARSLVDRLR